MVSNWQSWCPLPTLQQSVAVVCSFFGTFFRAANYKTNKPLFFILSLITFVIYSVKILFYCEVGLCEQQ